MPIGKETIRSAGILLASLLFAASSIASQPSAPRHLNKTIEKLEAGEIVFGSFASDKSPSGGAGNDTLSLLGSTGAAAGLFPSAHDVIVTVGLGNDRIEVDWDNPDFVDPASYGPHGRMLLDETIGTDTARSPAPIWRRGGAASSKRSASQPVTEARAHS